MFAASPPLKEKLLTLADQAFTPVASPKHQPGLLGKLGPLLRRAPEAPVIAADSPTRLDAENLAQGRYVPEPRLVASWAVLRHWLDELAWHTASWELTDAELDALDFDLARAGVVSQHGVRHLWSRDARLTLRPQHGTQVGYLRHDNAVSLAADWSRALPQLSGESSRTAGEIVSFLDRLTPYEQTASKAGRPAPDVVTLRTG